MKIDLNIFDSILFGDLRPWLPSNFHSEKFQAKLTTSFRCTDLSANNFERVINAALKDMVQNGTTENVIYEIDDSHIVFTQSDDFITGSLIEMEYQQYFNTKTEFYYYLIKNFATSQIRKIYLIVNFGNAEFIDRYIVNSVLSKVKSLLTETVKSIRQYGYEDELPFDQANNDDELTVRKDTDYILKTLRTNLIRMIFEIQELFPALLDTPVLTEDEIYTQCAGITSQNLRVAKDITHLNEFLVKKFISILPYSKSTALFRINYTKEFYNRYKDIPATAKDIISRKEELSLHIRALENLIYIREFLSVSENPTYEVLKSDQYIDEIYKSSTIAIQQELKDISKPVDKIEFINNKLESLSFINSGVSFNEADYKTSIPRKICRWLSIQQEYIKENLHIDPSILDAETKQKIKTNLTVHQLAYFFSLMDKVGLLDMSNKSDLCRAVISSFESKKQSDIDFESFKSKFYNLDINTIEFCHPKIKKMQEFAFEDKKNFGA